MINNIEEFLKVGSSLAIATKMPYHTEVIHNTVKILRVPNGWVYNSTFVPESGLDQKLVKFSIVYREIEVCIDTFFTRKAEFPVKNINYNIMFESQIERLKDLLHTHFNLVKYRELVLEHFCITRHSEPKLFTILLGD